MSAKFLNTVEATAALEVAGKFNRGEINLPPEILEKKKDIKRAIRNAELFMALMRVVDMGMVHDITRMRLELDGLYVAWIQRNAQEKSIH